MEEVWQVISRRVWASAGDAGDRGGWHGKLTQIDLGDCLLVNKQLGAGARQSHKGTAVSD
jgi:hypothetical protein